MGGAPSSVQGVLEEGDRFHQLPSTLGFIHFKEFSDSGERGVSSCRGWKPRLSFAWLASHVLSTTALEPPQKDHAGSRFARRVVLSLAQRLHIVRTPLA